MLHRKLTCHLKRDPAPKGNVIFQPSIFRGHVNFPQNIVGVLVGKYYIQSVIWISFWWRDPYWILTFTMHWVHQCLSHKPTRQWHIDLFQCVRKASISVWWNMMELDFDGISPDVELKFPCKFFFAIASFGDREMASGIVGISGLHIVLDLVFWWGFADSTMGSITFVYHHLGNNFRIFWKNHPTRKSKYCIQFGEVKSQIYQKIDGQVNMFKKNACLGGAIF